MSTRHDRWRRPTRTHRRRRGFNLVEMLISLGITAMLLTATMVALDASFMAYQTTTEQASTQTIGRMVLQRMQTMIRSSASIGPFPLSPLQRTVESNYIFISVGQNGAEFGSTRLIVMLSWDPTEERLYFSTLNAILNGGWAQGPAQLLLEGVMAATDPETGESIPPFTIEFDENLNPIRVTIDLTVRPDDNMDVELDGDWVQPLRFVASVQPRNRTLGAE